jgi:hypothetical protein
MWRRLNTDLAAVVWGCLVLGCSTPENAELRIKVIDATSRLPLASSVIGIEKGGLYVSNRDPSKGNASYQYGVQTGSDGTVRVTLPTDLLGVHSFAPGKPVCDAACRMAITTGYYYGARLVELDQDLGITLNMEPFQKGCSGAPDTICPPQITNEMWCIPPATGTCPAAATSVAPGAQFMISAQVSAGDPKDPLSEEVIVIHPDSNQSKALDPPSPPVSRGFPDGPWSATLTAPQQPATYQYYLSATSEGCVTSDTVPLTIIVQ